MFDQVQRVETQHGELAEVVFSGATLERAGCDPRGDRAHRAENSRRYLECGIQRRPKRSISSPLPIISKVATSGV